MVIRKLSRPEDLNALLAERRWYANGKNFPVDQLHETIAVSRWPRENLLGIYLTNPEHAWMAVWMAVTRRDCLRKRQLRYRRPATGNNDCLGRLEIYSPETVKIPALLAERAHLHLFDSTRFRDLPILDISGADGGTAALELLGFRRHEVSRRGWKRNGYVLESGAPALVVIDAWQVAVVNQNALVPDVRVALEPELISRLTDRITFSPTEIGADYLD